MALNEELDSRVRGNDVGYVPCVLALRYVGDPRVRTRQPAVYILASKRNGTVYIGVTSDLGKRLSQHQNGMSDSFTKEYGVHMLVYNELHQTMVDAIRREKRLKKWNRAWKLELIEKVNPDWRDLPSTMA